MEFLDYYRHPQWEMGVESHWFHQEGLRRVSGRLATYDEVGLSKSDYGQLFGRIKRTLTATDKRLLACLDAYQVPGVVGSTNWEDYVTSNTYVLRDDNDKRSPDLFGIAGPLSQRAVERREAIITVDNNIYLDHTVKGVGLTKSHDLKRICDYQMFVQGKDPFYGIGYVLDVAADYNGTLRAVGNEIDCPLLLPPIVFDDPKLLARLETLYLRGPIPELFLEQRNCATNMRVSSLYPAASLGIHLMELKYIEENAIPAIAVSRFLVDAYMDDVRAVREFNVREGTAYKLGNSNDFTGAYDYDDFVGAFRKQFVRNVARMVYKGQWHRNFIPQNIPIDGSVCDWDDWFAYDQRKKVFVWMKVGGSGTEPYSFDQEQTFARDAIRASYKIAAFVHALYLGEPMTLDDWWSVVRERIPSGHWSRSRDYNDLAAIHYMDRQEELYIQDGLIEFAGFMRKMI